MNNFPHDEQEQNVPGYDTFYFADAATIAALTIVSNIASAAPSMGGAVFYAGYSTQGKLQVQIEPVHSDDDMHYQVSIKGVLPKHKSANLQLFDEMINKNFNIIIRDKNGKYIYAGGPATLGLNFTYQLTDTGYTFEFRGLQIFPPPFFTGTIPV